MPWFKVDDALAMHMKAFAAGNKALGLWVRAGSWSMHQLTDGFIPQSVVLALGGDGDDAAALVNARLWHQADGGYQFHDWAEYQPTREKVLAEREATRLRVEKHRAKQSGNAVTSGVSTSAPSRPVPSRPDDSTYVSESSSVSERAREDETEEPSRRVLAGLGIDAVKLIGQIKRHTGRDVSVTTAMRVAVSLLDKGGDDVKNPQAYVLTSIAKSWAEVQKHIDTEAA